MEERSNILEEGIDRFQAAYRSAEGEIQKLQQRATKTSQELTDRLQTRARDVQKQLLEIPVVRRADQLRIDVTKQFESNVEGIIHRLPIASSNDLKKVDKKLNRLSRRLKALEKSQTEAE